MMRVRDDGTIQTKANNALQSGRLSRRMEAGRRSGTHCAKGAPKYSASAE